MRILDINADSEVILKNMNDIYNRSTTFLNLLTDDDIYNYIIYTHGSCIKDKKSEYLYISSYITKDNINSFCELFEYDEIKKSIFPNLHYDIISSYMEFDIEKMLNDSSHEKWIYEWITNNINWLYMNKRVIINKYKILEGISYYFRKRRCYYKFNKNIIMREIDINEKHILNKLYSSVDECFFIMSIENKNIEMIEFFINKCKDDKIYKHALIIASRGGHLNIVKYILSILTLSLLLTPDKELYNNLLITSAKHNHIHMIEYFIELGADINATYSYKDFLYITVGMTALKICCTMGNIDTVKYLLRKYPNIIDDETNSYIIDDDDEFSRILNKCGRKIKNSLVLSLMFNNIDIFKYLLTNVCYKSSDYDYIIELLIIRDNKNLLLYILSNHNNIPFKDYSAKYLSRIENFCKCSEGNDNHRFLPYNIPLDKNRKIRIKT